MDPMDSPDGTSAPSGAELSTPEMRARFDEALRLVPQIIGYLRSQLGVRAREDDMRSYASEGALTAARTFDAEAGVPFAQWAKLKMRGAVLDGLRADAELPRAMHEQLRALDRAGSTHEGTVLEAAASPPGSATAADALLSDRLAAMATAYAAGLLLKHGSEADDTMVDPHANPEEEVAREQLNAAVRSAIAERPEQERSLLEQHYFHDRPLSEASGGLSRGWACRLHARAIAGVARALKRERIKP
jgi:RNA polymerase sigma factor for flagellar operon FliA